jgi:hypothetical protein
MFKYGAIVYFCEWVSEDGEESEWSNVRTEWFASKEEMKQRKQEIKELYDPDEWMFEFFKVKKWYD